MIRTSCHGGSPAGRRPGPERGRRTVSRSWRGGAWVSVGAFARHCEAAKRPKQSRRAVQQVMGGRRTVSPRRFWIASRSLALALAMTGNEGPSLRGREAAEAIQAGGAAGHGREAYRVAAPLLDCFALACARARNDGGAAVPHVTGGRRTVWPRRFWIASPALRAGSQ